MSPPRSAAAEPTYSARFGGDRFLWPDFNRRAEVGVMKGFSLERLRPGVLLPEDHLQSPALHREVRRRDWRLVNRSDCNSRCVPRGVRLRLSTFREQLALMKEIHLDAPVRIRRFAWNRRSPSSPRHG